MKFLCVECNEAMRLESADGPDRGSMTVLFTCPSCGRQTAMLTNSMETQVVRSLGVKIGGRTTSAEPMETIRESLVGSRYSGPPSDADAPSEVASLADQPASYDEAGLPSPATHPDRSDRRANGSPQTSKCPFTGMVNDAIERQQGIRWSDGARRRMERIPEFARSMVMKGVEDAAKARGADEVTEAVLDQVRGEMGI